jgi:hypothetical protein
MSEKMGIIEKNLIIAGNFQECFVKHMFSYPENSAGIFFFSAISGWKGWSLEKKLGISTS